MAAKPTETTKTRTVAAPKAVATTTTAGPASFDAKGNKAAKILERGSETKVSTSEHTVLPGKSVRAGGLRHGQGESVQLTDVDSERLIAKGVVVKGKGGATATKAKAEAADAEAARLADAADAQRAADEKAAADKEAADLAAGKLSGTENR